jgi:hypothetical protein
VPDAPAYDPALLDALARVFAELALDRLIAEAASALDESTEQQETET